MSLTANEEFADLAYRKAILQHVQELLRNTRTDALNLTQIVAEDMPVVSCHVPQHAVQKYLLDLEQQVQGMNDKMSRYVLVQVVPSPRSEDPAPSNESDPFDD